MTTNSLSHASALWNVSLFSVLVFYRSLWLAPPFAHPPTFPVIFRAQNSALAAQRVSRSACPSTLGSNVGSPYGRLV